MRVGDDVKVEAPNGTFIFDGAQADGVALIGAGVGITPMMSVARYLAENGLAREGLPHSRLQSTARFYFGSSGNRVGGGWGNGINPDPRREGPSQSQYQAPEDRYRRSR
jgi:hypothetical protein